MQQTGGARIAGFYRIFFFSVLALCFSLFLATTSRAAAAVGATPGKFAVSNSGRASYTIPLALPPGINGVQPSLALRYRSGSGNGLLGLGWSISGLPVIHRCKQTKAQNGESHGVDYSQADRLCLNGNQLREVSDGHDYWDNDAEYRTERERFVRITQDGSGDNASFKVEYKNGKIAEFGNTSDSRINATNGSGIRLWAINQLEDRNGNAVVYSYYEDTDNGSYRPKSIKYADGFYTITFNYNTNRPDPIIAYYGGGERSQYARLNEINITAAGGATVRRYAVAYDEVSGKSQLTSITECASAGTSDCFKPTTFSGQAAVSGWVTDESLSTDHPYSSARTADINHDGIADLIYETSPSDYTQSKVVVRFGTPQGLSSTQVHTGIKSALQWYIVNLDRDGRPALFNFTGHNNGVLHRYHNGVFTSEEITLPDAFASNGDIWKFKFADLNNDGLDDILYLKDEMADGDTNPLGKHTLGIIWRTDNGWSQGLVTELPFSVVHVVWPGHIPAFDYFNTLKIADMNKDNRPEVLLSGVEITRDCSTGACIYMTSRGGYQLHLTASGWQVQSIRAPINTGSVLADVNGDGYPDLANELTVWLNNGQYPAKNVSTNPPAYNWPIAADLDGDGASELIYSNEHLPSADPAIPWDEVDTYTDPDLDSYSMVRFEGGSFSQPVTIWSNAPNIWPDAPIKEALQAADFNGDGLDDLMTDTLEVRMNTGQRQIAVTSITNGFGTNWTINYSLLTDPSVYAPGDKTVTYPRQHYAGTRQVVKSYTVNDGAGSVYTATYNYTGAKVNVNGRGFLGFAKRTVDDSRLDPTVTEQFKQAYPYIGITHKKTLTGPDGTISQTTITPAKKTWGDGDKQRVYVYPETTVTISYLLDQVATDTVLKTTTRKITPTFNNIEAWIDQQKTITTISGSKTFTTKKTVVYSNTNTTTSWCLGQPSSTTVTRTAHSDIHTQATKADIDGANCRVNSQTLKAAGSNPAVTTSYQYDAWGNVTKTTVSAPNAIPAVASRSTSASYDLYHGRFPDTLTNAADHVTTLTWYEDLGLKESITDPNGLKTTFSYDAFGRLSKTDYPDDRVVELTYDWCEVGECPGGDSAYRVLVEQASNRKSGAPSRTSGADAVTIYDSFGRKVVTGTQGLNNKWSYRYTHYNHLGQVDAQSQPHLTTGQYGGANDNDALKFSRVASALKSMDSDTGSLRDSGYWTNYTYDTLGRVIKIDHPNGGETTTVYNGFNVTVTNPNGQTTIKNKNAIGQTVKMTEAKSNITKYTYDAAGNLIKTVDPLTNTITMTYDNRGNKLTMVDPDMGSWKYDYNAFGEMIKQTDAKLQITTMEYDTLGRLTKRIEGAGGSDEVTSQWTYGKADSAGESENDIGKLVKVTSTGFEKAITYDEYSRPKKTTVTIKGEAYTTTTTYDEFGRVASIQYPASFPISDEKVTAVITSNATEVILGRRDIILDGSSSIGDNLSYYWEQTGGPDTPITNPDNVQVTISPSEVGEYAFKLTVGNGLNDDGPNDATSCLEILDAGSEDDTSCIDVLQVIPPSARNFGSNEGGAGQATSKDGSYTLSWDAPSGGLPVNTQYYLYESTLATEQGELLYDGVCVKEGACRKKTVHNRSNGDWHYELEVCQTNTDLCSNHLSLTVGVKRPPAVPAAPAIDDSYSTDGSYTISWAVTNADYWYKLTETDIDDNISGAWSFTNSDVNFKDFSGKTNGTWHYAVQACHTNFESCSGLSAEKTVRVAVPPPSITVPSSSTGNETIEWDKASGEVDHYELQQSRSASFSSPTTWETGSLAKYVTVTGNYSYYYRVRACYQGDGSYCTPWRSGSRGMRNYGPPGTPSSIWATVPVTSGQGARVNVSWTEAPGAETRYELYRQVKMSQYGNWETWRRVQNNNSRSYTQYTRTLPRTRFRVRACNSIGCSGYVTSNVVKGTGTASCWMGCGTSPLPDRAESAGGLQTATDPASHKGARAMMVNTAPTTGFHAQPPARPYDLLRHSRAEPGPSAGGAGNPSSLTPSHRRGEGQGEGAFYQQLARAYKTAASPPPPPPRNAGDRFTVKYNYGSYGHLTQVVNYYDADQVFWEAQKADAYGHITQVKLGNGLTTQRSYDQVTGRLTGIATGRLESSQVTAAIQNLSYQWDDIGNLKQRENLNQGRVETFTYDALNRLTKAALSSGRVTTLTYDEIGNIKSKTTTIGAAAETRAYIYGKDAAGPHAVTKVGNISYQYDANGNMTSGNGRQITWDAANYPTEITQGATTKTFAYGPAKQRYLQTTSTSSGTTKTITVGGLYQKITNVDTGAVKYQHYIRAAGKTIAIHTRTDDYAHKIEYLHRDHLGSVVAVTDEDGNIVTRMRYDAFGKRTVVTGAPTDRGYTGHQMLDDVGLIHMNGRVYDPAIGRFLSADPFIQAPYNSQSYNRYSYVLNNPLSLVDPSGFLNDDPPVQELGTMTVEGAPSEGMTCGVVDGENVCTVTGDPENTGLGPFEGMYSHGIGYRRMPSEVQGSLRQSRDLGDESTGNRDTALENTSGLDEDGFNNWSFDGLLAGEPTLSVSGMAAAGVGIVATKGLYNSESSTKFVLVANGRSFSLDTNLLTVTYSGSDQLVGPTIGAGFNIRLYRYLGVSLTLEYIPKSTFRLSVNFGAGMGKAFYLYSFGKRFEEN